MSLNQHLENASGGTYPLPAGLFIRGFERPQDLRMVEFDGGQVVPRTPLRRAARGILEGTIRATSYANAIAELDNLLRFLSDPPIKVRLQGAADRYIEAYAQLVDDSRTRMAHRPEVYIPLVAPNPWFVGTPGSFSESISGTVNRTIDNTGGLRTPATIVLSGGAANSPTITNGANAQSLSYSGGLTSGDTLTADGERRTLDLDGANALGSAGPLFLRYGFWLEPGANNIEIATGSGPITVDIDWTPRYA